MPQTLTTPRQYSRCLLIMYNLAGTTCCSHGIKIVGNVIQLMERGRTNYQTGYETWSTHVD